MDIGTNKVLDPFEVEHHMLNLIDSDQNFSVNDFMNDSKNIISTLNSRSIMPIVTGGTGLYIGSLLFDMNYGEKIYI